MTEYDEAKIDKMANAVDRLSGQLAALTAFVIVSSAPLMERELAAAKTFAEQFSRSKVGPQFGARVQPSPGAHARRHLEKIQSMVDGLSKARSAGGNPGRQK